MKNCLLGPLLLCWPVWAAAAENEAAASENTALERIVVVGHRQPRKAFEVAGTVTVLDSERLERDLAIDILDAVRYEPGVEVDGGGTRFGFGGISIRGLGGNRTAVLIDDIPVPDRFSVGNFADSGRGMLELGLVGRVEILRGPASTLYGSKALGGVVAVRLLDAEDLLAGRARAHRIGLAAASDRDRIRLVGASALRQAHWTALVAGAVQTADEVDVARRPADVDRDRQEQNQGAALLRLTRDTGGGRLRLSFDGIRDERESELRALLGAGRFANTSRLDGDDRRNQWRLLVDHELVGWAPVERGRIRVWRQFADTRQETFEERPTAPVPVDLFRRFEFRQETTGAGADLESVFRLGSSAHRIGYGFEWSRGELEQQRNARQTSRLTGTSSNVVLGERFPLRDFPNTRVTELGLYLHDEIQIGSGGPTISPGLRFEYYELDSRADARFTDAFPDAEVIDLDTTAWMPKLGLLWPLRPGMEWFVQYARGFRSPPFSDVNIGLDIPLFNVRAIPNPALEPERGRTLETGLRWRREGTQVELSLFRNRYRDFIETRAALGPDPQSGVLLFQSINRDRVRIEGAELRARQAFLTDFNLEVAAEWLRGEDRENSRSLPEIAPPKAVAALEYAPASDWSIRLLATAQRSQRRLVAANGNPLFSTPGYVVLDLIGRWEPYPQLRLALGLFNLADRQAFNNAAVLNRPPDDPTLPLLAEPGRNLRASLDWLF